LQIFKKLQYTYFHHHMQKIHMLFEYEYFKT